MKNNLFCKCCAVIAFLLSCSCVMSQSEVGVKTYRRASADSVRLRSSIAGESGKAKRRGKSSSVKKNASPKVKKTKVDSLSFVPKQFLLGERVIMPGDSGRDVRAVAKILVNKIYIDEADIVYTSDGGVLYDAALIKAVKRFQEFNGFFPDGIIGQELIKALRKRKSER